MTRQAPENSVKSRAGAFLSIKKATPKTKSPFTLKVYFECVNPFLECDIQRCTYYIVLTGIVASSTVHVDKLVVTIE